MSRCSLLVGQQELLLSRVSEKRQPEEWVQLLWLAPGAHLNKAPSC